MLVCATSSFSLQSSAIKQDAQGIGSGHKGVVDSPIPNSWYQSYWFKDDVMSRVGTSSMATKFDVEKFNGKGNFRLWQKRVNALLVP